MTLRAQAPALALAALLVAALPAFGQELAAGTWTGTVEPPDDPVVQVEYEVSYDEQGALQIVIFPPPGSGAPAEVPFEDEAFEDGSLTFSWQPGVPLVCELLLQDDGSLEGECADPDGMTGYLTMVPPA